MSDKIDNRIRVTEENWKRLNSRRNPGDSFNDVLHRLLDENEGVVEVAEDAD